MLLGKQSAFNITDNKHTNALCGKIRSFSLIQQGVQI